MGFFTRPNFPLSLQHRLVEAAGRERGREHGVTGGEGPGTEQEPVLTLRVRDGVPPGIRSFLCLVLQDRSLDSNLKFIDIYYSNMLSRNRTCIHNWKYQMTGGFVGFVCLFLFLPTTWKHPHSPPSNLEGFTSTNSQPSLERDYSFVPVQGYPPEPISRLAASRGSRACSLKSGCPLPAFGDQREPGL